MAHNRLQSEIAAERKIVVARSLSIDKPRLLLSSLIPRFFSVSPTTWRPRSRLGPKRERLLQELFRKCKKPVVLFIDEAHDRHGNTLTGLKRSMEIMQAGGGVLSIVRVGHPRLRNDLNRPTMAETGHRTTKLTFEGLGDERRAFTEAFVLGTKPVTRDIVEATLWLGFDDLDAGLAGMGYSPKTPVRRRLPSL